MNEYPPGAPSSLTHASEPTSFTLRGRHDECETLDRLVANIRQEQSSALVLRGEAGTGKTALLAEAASLAADGRIVVFCGGGDPAARAVPLGAIHRARVADDPVLGRHRHRRPRHPARRAARHGSAGRGTRHGDQCPAPVHDQRPRRGDQGHPRRRPRGRLNHPGLVPRRRRMPGHQARSVPGRDTMPALSAQPFRASQGHHLRLRTAEHLNVERKRYDCL